MLMLASSKVIAEQKGGNLRSTNTGFECRLNFLHATKTDISATFLHIAKIAGKVSVKEGLMEETLP